MPMLWSPYFVALGMSSLMVLTVMFFEPNPCVLSFSLSSLLPFETFWVFDKISLTFLTMTCVVSTSIFFYTQQYMMSDPFKKGFEKILLSFAISMIFLSLSGNLVSMMIGWDGLGITSFCLIIFFQNWSSFNSGMITFISNRLGDVAIIVVILTLLSSSFEFFEQEESFFDVMGGGVFTSCLLALGGMTKSAQFPFSAWLPRAMAAPTPVSALVHSSTLVTAGVFLVSRFYLFLESEVLVWISFMSMFTIILSGVCSLYESDLKKIVALSTLSHISLMIFVISNGFVLTGLAHMVMHAIFKSILFMVCGQIIHSSGGEQDVRRLSIQSMGMGLKVAFLVSVLGMMGAPFLSGFFSKELILCVLGSDEKLMVCVCLLIASMLTCSYSVRIISLMSKKPYSPSLSSGVGPFQEGFYLLMGFNSSIFAGVVVSFLHNNELPSWEGNNVLKIFLFVSMGLGCVLGWLVSVAKQAPSISKLLGSMWMIDSINDFLSLITRKSSWIVGSWSDVKGMTDKIIVFFQKSWVDELVFGIFLWKPLLQMCVLLLFSGVLWSLVQTWI